MFTDFDKRYEEACAEMMAEHQERVEQMREESEKTRQSMMTEHAQRVAAMVAEHEREVKALFENHDDEEDEGCACDEHATFAPLTNDVHIAMLSQEVAHNNHQQHVQNHLQFMDQVNLQNQLNIIHHNF